MTVQQGMISLTVKSAYNLAVVLVTAALTVLTAIAFCSSLEQVVLLLTAVVVAYSTRALICSKKQAVVQV